MGRSGPTFAHARPVAIDLSSVDALQTALGFHRERHTVLAGNVANLDTPGYRPSDLKRVMFGEGEQALATTSAGHLGTSHLEGSAVAFDDGGDLQSPDGNAVQLERELAKIDANRTRYATSAELVSRRLAMLRYAAGDGQ